MTKRMSLLEIMARLNWLERQPFTDELRAELLELLRHPINAAVARAAAILGKSGDVTVIPALIARAESLFAAPPDADKACLAKEALIEALDALGHFDEAIYLRGIAIVQMEPVYGGRADTAANLRGACGRALARHNPVQAHFALAGLLMDSEMPARAAAINALAYLGDEKSELLLRMKVLAGDSEPHIIGDCLAALMQIEPARSTAFVARYLNGDDPVMSEQAALALGESQSAEALAALLDYWRNLVDFTFRKTLLLAIALHRSEDAFAFLLHVICEEGRGAALKAIDALAIYSADEKRRNRIREAVEATGDEAVTKARSGRRSENVDYSCS